MKLINLFIMNRYILLVLLSVVYLGVSAQEAEPTLLQRELQIEIGESAIIQYISGENNSPTISTTYNRRINKKWWYGVSAAYSHDSRNRVYTGTLYKENTYKAIDILCSNNDVFSIIPAIKFSYYNGERLQMYSGLQAGFSLVCGKNLYADGRTVSGSTMNFFLQLTAFGINYGKDFYIGAEAGLGFKGVLNFVAGYRF